MASISIGKKDVFWSYVGSFFRLAANIILLPFMLHFLSDEDLGLWYVFAGISQFVVLLDFGFAPALSRNIAYIWCGAKELKKEDVSEESHFETDYLAFKNILMTCKYIYLTLTIVAFILLSTAGTLYVLSLNSSNKDVLLAWIIYGSGVLLNLYYSYFTSFLRGVGAVAQNNIAGVLSKLIQIVFSCILLFYGWGILGASIGYFVSGIVLRLYSTRAFYSYEDVGVSLKKLNISLRLKDCWNTFVIIWYNASKEGLITLSNFLSTQANTLICSSVLGLATTGSYGITVQLATIVTGMSNIFSIVYFFLSIVAVLCIPIVIWFKPTFNVDYYMMSALFGFMFIDKIYHNFTSYISNSNRLPYTIPFIVSSLISVFLSFSLASFTKMGIWALIVAPIIVALVYNVWKWPKFVLKENRIGFCDFINLGWELIMERADIIINKWQKKH